MERLSIALLAAIALVLGSTVLAQEPGARGAPPVGQGQNMQLSDADLEKFADIYVDLTETVAKFEAELAKAKSGDDQLEVQERMQQESVAKVAQHGWTPERYVSVGDAINANPALAEKTLALIDDRD
jgi:Domain of unknown function (DUF4168)